MSDSVSNERRDSHISSLEVTRPINGPYRRIFPLQVKSPSEVGGVPANNTIQTAVGEVFSLYLSILTSRNAQVNAPERWLLFNAKPFPENVTGTGIKPISFYFPHYPLACHNVSSVAFKDFPAL